VNTKEELAGFVTLQRLLDRKSVLKQQIATPPEPLVQLRTSGDSRRAALAEKQARRGVLSAEQEQLAKEIEDLREEREHFRKQKSLVTTMKQLTAVVSELDHVEGQLKSREERLLAVMQELETLDADLAVLQRETPEERAAREAAEAAWEEQRRLASEELEGVERRIREVGRQLGPAAFERFKRLWNSRRPHAVVPLDGTACSACHAELRPSLVQQVRTGEELQYCDTCRRLLYDPDTVNPLW